MTTKAVELASTEELKSARTLFDAEVQRTLQMLRQRQSFLKGQIGRIERAQARADAHVIP